MKNKTPENEILKTALKKLEETTEFRVEAHPEIDPKGPDTVIQITWQNMEWHFAADVKYTLTRVMIGATVQQLRRHMTDIHGGSNSDYEENLAFVGELKAGLMEGPSKSKRQV